MSTLEEIVNAVKALSPPGQAEVRRLLDTLPVQPDENEVLVDDCHQAVLDLDQRVERALSSRLGERHQAAENRSQALSQRTDLRLKESRFRKLLSRSGNSVVVVYALDTSAVLKRYVP